MMNRNNTILGFVFILSWAGSLLAMQAGFGEDAFGESLSGAALYNATKESLNPVGDPEAKPILPAQDSPETQELLEVDNMVQNSIDAFVCDDEKSSEETPPIPEKLLFTPSDQERAMSAVEAPFFESSDDTDMPIVPSQVRLPGSDDESLELFEEQPLESDDREVIEEAEPLFVQIKREKDAVAGASQSVPVPVDDAVTRIERTMLRESCTSAAGAARELLQQIEDGPSDPGQANLVASNHDLTFKLLLCAGVIAAVCGITWGVIKLAKKAGKAPEEKKSESIKQVQTAVE